MPSAAPLDGTEVPHQRPQSSADSKRNNYALTLGDFVGAAPAAADRDPLGRRSRYSAHFSLVYDYHKLGIFVPFMFQNQIHFRESTNAIV